MFLTLHKTNIMQLHASFALLILILHYSKTSFALTNYSTDQSALLEFKTRYITSDPGSILASNWTISSRMCNWVGVTCGVRHRRVVGLNLTNMGLVGTVAPHLGNLSFLVSFDISSNHFHGDLPKELSDLHRLRILRIHTNNFGGEVLSWVTNISSLEYLILSNNSFTGVIPVEIGNLVNLRYLTLASNKFTGQIPHSVGNLTGLTYLILVDNNFEGEIPSELGNLVNLEGLAIGGARHVGALPSSIFNISSLQRLAVRDSNIFGSLPSDMCTHLPRLGILLLYNNRFTGTIPNSVGNCTSMEVFSLLQNYMTGEIPSEIGSLQKLQDLNLGYNNFSGVIPSTIFNTSKMIQIEMSRNNLSGQVPSNIGELLPNLEYLGLARNKLSGIIPSSIANASKLSTLTFMSNSFSGFIPTTIGNLRQLQFLNLAVNNLSIGSPSQTSRLFSFLSGCVRLRYFALFNNPFNSILPSSIGNLSSSLQNLYLYGCQFNGDIPPQIGNLSGLIIMNLGFNGLGGNIPATFRQLKELQGLQLDDNNFRGQIPNELCQLQELGLLSLRVNNLNGAIPSCLGNITSLRYLYLDSNKLSSVIPPSLFALEYILDMRLNDNSLRGSVPPEIGTLKVATVVALSGNNLSGNIPSSLGSLKNLAYLYLERNGLQGSIPESLGELISLESLDLSENSLIGVIPKSLEKLLYLKEFNVSFNRLEGEIPEGGPFKNFSAQSFMWNLLLCGPPRFHVQPCKSITNTRTRRSRVVTLLLKLVVPLVAFLMLVVVLVFIIKHCPKRKRVLQEDDVLDLPTWRRVSYYELEQATNGFIETNLLGSGSFGSVYKGVLLDGMSIAVKVFNLQLEGAYESFETESKFIASIRHRNLIKVISCCSNTDFKGLVLEFMPNGSLEQWLYSGDRFLNLFQRLNIMIDVASALEYLHCGYSTPVVHCDLKPSNVLLDQDMVARVADFGLTKLLGGVDSLTRTMTLATIGYMAPEYGSEGIVSIKCDVYSFGVLLMETFTRRKPTNEMFVGGKNLRNWVKESLPHLVKQIVDEYLLGEVQENSAVAIEIVTSILELGLACTSDSPKERMEMNDVLATLKKIKLKLSRADNARKN